MLSKENEKALLKKMKSEERLAYDVVKALKRQTNKRVSYSIEYTILLDNGNIKVVTSIKQYPVIHIGHNLDDVADEYSHFVDIDNIED